jgi:hypothetical protein
LGATAQTRAGSVAPAARQSPAREPRPAGSTSVDDTRERDLTQRKAAAQANLAEAERALAAASGAERTANDEVDQLTGEIARVRGLLEAAQLAARAARQGRIAAERQHESAQRRLRREGP